MIDSGLTRRVKTLHRDLGWALVMSREGVLSEAAFQRLQERFTDMSSALSSRQDWLPDREQGPDLVQPGAEVNSASAIADWLRYLDPVINPRPVVPELTLGPK
jgi:hypothetical protein